MRALTTALTTMRRTPYQALVSILMVSVTFFVAYVFSLLVAGAHVVLQYFETRPQIIAFFELKTEPQTIKMVEQNMQGKPYVKEVTIVSQEQALELYKKENQDDPLLLELVTADILPASIEVSAIKITDLPQIKEDLEKATQVEDVVYQQDIVDALNRWSSSLRILGLGAVAVLGTISFLIVMVLIAIKAANQRRAIGIMRIIGATKGYVQGPFVLEGMLYGLVGSLIGWACMYTGLLYTSPWIKDFLGEIAVLPIPPEYLAGQLGIGTLTGMLLGSLAGSIAVRRYLK
ncbi:ABC transporter permease [Candidatus Woesebacteria bacterium]|nr:ABC transporter permease [Candidatus Woesebacteria bacterium]